MLFMVRKQEILLMEEEQELHLDQEQTLCMEEILEELLLH